MFKNIDKKLYDQVVSEHWSEEKAHNFIKYQNELKKDVKPVISIFGILGSFLALIVSLGSVYFSIEFSTYNTLLSQMISKGTEDQVNQIVSSFWEPALIEVDKMINVMEKTCAAGIIILISYWVFCLIYNKKKDKKIRTIYEYLINK